MGSNSPMLSFLEAMPFPSLLNIHLKGQGKLVNAPPPPPKDSSRTMNDFLSQEKPQGQVERFLQFAYETRLSLLCSQ